MGKPKVTKKQIVEALKKGEVQLTLPVGLNVSAPLLQPIKAPSKREREMREALEKTFALKWGKDSNG